MQVRGQPASSGTVELLERSAELSILQDRISEVAERPVGHLVLVGGEAGVGKTELLRRFCDDAPGSVRVLWASCDPLFTPADRLIVSQWTVEHHISAILRKLDVRTRGEAAAQAARLGLLGHG